MQTSAEIRWFWRRELPYGLKDWFCEGSAHGFRAGGGGKRVDIYLLDISQTELGIKQRGEKKGIEIKGLVAVAEVELNVSPFSGKIELWTKWTSGRLKLPEDFVLAMNKWRWLRKAELVASRFVRVVHACRSAGTHAGPPQRRDSSGAA